MMTDVYLSTRLAEIIKSANQRKLEVAYQAYTVGQKDYLLFANWRVSEVYTEGLLAHGWRLLPKSTEYQLLRLGEAPDRDGQILILYREERQAIFL